MTTAATPAGEADPILGGGARRASGTPREVSGWALAGLGAEVDPAGRRVSAATRQADAAREWLAASAAHRAIVGDPCARCGALRVDLDPAAGGYRCSECGWQPEGGSG